MKTNEQALRVLKLHHGAGLLALLLLVSAEVWMMCSLAHGCGQVTAPPAVQFPAMGDWFAAK
jgi:hypothetical protein